MERSNRPVLISIIIPAHNAAATIGKCVDACLQQTHRDIEVIVVDDGSTDDTAGIVDAMSTESPVSLRCIRQVRRGPAAARNRGAREAKGSILAYTDADCVPQPDWIARLAAGFAEGVAAVGGTYGIANPEYLLARMVHQEILCRHAAFGDEVDFLGSYNAAYRRETFEAVGGFDETYPSASAEDNDLAYRLIDAGGRLRFVNDAVVAHYHPTRLWPYLRTQLRHGYWRMKLYANHPRRASRGDRYAGLADLVAPPLTLVVLALAAGYAMSIAWTPVSKPIGALLLAAAGAYTLIRVALPIKMVAAARDARMLAFAGVAALRDLSRAAGMAAGIVRFWVLERWRNR